MSFDDNLTSFWESCALHTVEAAGTISCEHGNQHGGHLRMWQLVNGCLAIEFVTEAPLHCHSSYHFQGGLVHGDALVDEWHIEAGGIQLNHSVLPAPHFRNWHILGTVDDYVAAYNVGNTKPTSERIVCEITNLYLNRPVELTLDGFQVSLAGKREADHNYMQALTLGGPAILAEIRVTATQSRSDGEWDEFIDRLCCLLSLACRNHVGKVSKLRFNEKADEPVSRIFYGLGVKSTRAAKRLLIASENLPEYLQQAFPRLHDAYALWHLGAALDHYLLAMDSVSAWPMGIGIVVALECLVSAFAEGQGQSYHFSSDIEGFNPFLKPLAELILKFLNSHFPEQVKNLNENKDERQSWLRGLQNLNRRSFKRKMRGLLDALSIKPPDPSLLQLIVDIRNDLVHYGYPASEEWSREFGKIMRMAGILEQIFLATLEYRGPFQEQEFVAHSL